MDEAESGIDVYKRQVVGVALGYRAKDDAYAREAKVRFPAGEVIDIRA